MANSLAEPPVLPIQHFRMALRMLKAPIELVDRLLERSGLTSADLENPHLEMPASAIWSICDNVSHVFGDDWFLDFPVLWSVSTHSELGMAMRFAPDFGTAIDVVVEFAHVRWPVLRVRRTTDRLHVILALALTVPTSQRNWQLAYSLAALSFDTTAKYILQGGSETIQYQFPGPPPFYADRLAKLFEANVSWGHERAAIVVPKNLSEQVSALVNNTAFAALLGSLRELSTCQGQFNTMVARVTQTLDGVTHGRIDATEVARKIGISKRTLERRLAEEGANFRELLNKSYKKRLEHLLLDRQLTAEAIAERLGYHDASSLLRATRRLYGDSFSRLRREVRSK